MKMKALGEKRFESNDSTKQVRRKLLPIQLVLVVLGCGMVGVGFFFQVLNLYQNEVLDGIYALVLIFGIIPISVAIALSGKIVRVAVYELGFKYWCANGYSRSIGFDDVLRMTLNPDRISIFVPTIPNHASYKFNRKYVTDLNELYEALTVAFEGYLKERGVSLPVQANTDNVENDQPLSIKERMRNSVIFSTYLFTALLTAVFISNGFTFTGAVIRVPLYAVIGYLVAKIIRRKGTVNDINTEVLTLLFSVLVLAIASFTTGYHTFGNRALNLILILLVLIFLGILWWLGVGVIKHNNDLSVMLKALGTYVGVLFSKKKRQRNKEYQRIWKLLLMECEPAQFITEASRFLAREDVKTEERAFLQHQISYAHGTMGNYEVAFRMLEEMVLRFEVEPEAFERYRKGHFYDQLLKWALTMGDKERVEIYRESCEKHRDGIDDELFPYSQSYEAIAGGHFDEALAYFEKRREVYQEKNLLMTTLSEVEEQFERGLIHEEMGELEKQKSSLQFVARNGGSTKMAAVAREKLVAMGVEMEAETRVTDAAGQPAPKKGALLLYVIVLLVAIGLWIFLSR